MAEESAGPTPDEVVEQLRQLKVSDLLLSTLFTLSQLAYGKLDAPTRDLEQARLAIDAIRALLPVLETGVPAEATRDFRQMVVNLQLAYASAVSEGQTPGPGRAGEEPSSEATADDEPAQPDTSSEGEKRGQTPGQVPTEPASEGDGGS